MVTYPAASSLVKWEDKSPLERPVSPLQVEEISAFDRGEDAHNHQAGWLVNQPVKSLSF